METDIRLLQITASGFCSSRSFLHMQPQNPMIRLMASTTQSFTFSCFESGFLSRTVTVWTTNNGNTYHIGKSSANLCPFISGAINRLYNVMSSPNINLLCRKDLKYHAICRIPKKHRHHKVFKFFPDIGQYMIF